MKAISGRLADLRARKPLIASGYGLSSLTKVLIGLASAWPLVLVARFADRVGHPAVVGPLAGLALYPVLGRRIRPPFFVAVIPAAVSVALVGLVHETRRPPRPPQPAARTGGRRDGVPLPPGYWRVVAVLGVFGLANFSDALLIRAGELGLGLAGIALVYALDSAVYSPVSVPAGRLSDRVPGRVVFAAGVWAGFAWGGTGRLPLLVSGIVAGLLAAVLFAGGRRFDAAGGSVRSRS